jgi:hypothetical protein
VKAISRWSWPWTTTAGFARFRAAHTKSFCSGIRIAELQNLQRDPHSGTAEEDWRKAEAEIEAEGHPRSHHKGPAKLKDQSHWGKLTNHAGEDFENPA